MPHGPTRTVLLHPAVVRVTHWLNTLAVLVMIGSGWRIYNNDPIFEWVAFPIWATLGGDPEISYAKNGDAGFGNALLWHFAGMWLLVVNGLIYVAYGFVSGRFARKLWPISPSDVVSVVRDTLRFKLSHDDVSIYNGVQKLLYIGVLLALAGVVLSGVAIWKPVQAQELTALMGGFQGARLVHFLCMAAIAGFLAVHVALAMLVPATLKAMVIGTAQVPVSQVPALVTPVPAE